MTLSYKTCFGLYAYLRQLELSLDRALSEDISGIKKYFESKDAHSLISVAKYFEEIVQKGESKYIDSHPTILFSKLIHAKKIEVSETDLLLLIKYLKESYGIINAQVLDIKKFSAMRILVNTANERIIGSKIRISDQRKAAFIEHYNQNDYLNFKDIDTIIGSKWLDV